MTTTVSMNTDENRSPVDLISNPIALVVISVSLTWCHHYPPPPPPRLPPLLSLTSLPEYGVVEIVTHGSCVHDGDQQQVQTHAKVGCSKVTHEELGHGQPESAAE